MNCSKCNAEIDDNAMFCPECGSKIEKQVFCANCGAKLEEGAAFCSNCGEKTQANAIESKLKDKPHEDNHSDEDLYGVFNMHFVSQAPTFSTKIAQWYYLQSRSRMLKEFKLNDGTIYISTWGGDRLTAPIKECKFSYDALDDHGNKKIICVKHGNRKIVFIEISESLSEEEWGLITDFCIVTCNAQKTNLNLSMVIFYIIAGLIIIVVGVIAILPDLYGWYIIIGGLFLIGLGIRRLFRKQK
ncbi:MAG: zinc ribbon domain-containing protein [Bacteroidales bacterium]|nr:zinc ribbon domain-containing protein [Bacteroidales bacterium]